VKLPATFKQAFEDQMISEARAIIRDVRDNQYTFPPDSRLPGRKFFRFDKAERRSTCITCARSSVALTDGF
jgi:hypothetical protein